VGHPVPIHAKPRRQRRRRGGRGQLGEESTPHGLQGHRRGRRIIDNLDVEHEEMVSLTTFFVKPRSRLFSAKFAKSMACRRNVKLRRCLLTLSAGRTDASTGPACVGFIDLWAQAEVPNALRTDTPKPFQATPTCSSARPPKQARRSRPSRRTGKDSANYEHRSPCRALGVLAAGGGADRLPTVAGDADPGPGGRLA